MRLIFGGVTHFPFYYPQRKKKMTNAATEAGVPAGFIHSLWAILSDTANADVIAWNADGTAFSITDAAALEQRVLPNYFLTNRVASFVRQLSAYGFVSMRLKGRRTASSSSGAANAVQTFRHAGELFIRDKPELSARIARYKPRRWRGKHRRSSNKRQRSRSPASDESFSDSGDEPAAPAVVDDEERVIRMQLEAQQRRIAYLTEQVALLEQQLVAEPVE